MKGVITHCARGSGRIRLHLLAGVAASVCSAPAFAQDADQAPETESSQPAQTGNTIIVTGSRIQRSGMNAPTPVTVIGAEQLEQIAPTTLSEGLSQLPQFLNSDRPATTGISYSGNAGASYLNLRSLGSSRTLVLLDGRRVVPATRQGTTDISMLPQALVERVDVVTGGASAAYGSDAVTGVVNFLLDDDFEGIKGRVQGGISSRGDDENYRIELAAGFALGERTHLVMSAEYFSTEGVEDYRNRDWFEGWASISNPDYPNGPREVIFKNVKTRSLTYGGLITSGPLAGTQFLEGGVPAPFYDGDYVTSSSQVGGSGVDVGEYFQLSPKNNRGNFFAHLSHEFSPSLKGYVQFLYGRTRQNWHGTAAGQYPPTWPLTIYRDNAFLPESIREKMFDLGIESFQMGRMADPYAAGGDFPFNRFQMNGDTYSVTAGLDGNLGSWRWQAYYQYGQSDQYIDIYNNPRLDRLYQAVDAVIDPDSGRIVCSSTLIEGPNGCVPLDVFGPGAPSDEAIDWILGSAIQNQRIKQHFLEANIQGEPFSTWAGDVSVALGAAYRKETLRQRSNADTLIKIPELPGQDLDPDNPSANYRGLPAAYAGRQGPFERGNPKALSGGYDVWEVFGEVLVPLATDISFARHLDVSGAVRYAHYQGSGGVTTWKGGVTWEPFSGLRLRATRSRDIRAPNLGERFDSSRGAGQARDPLNGNEMFVFTAVTGGNPNARPEKADTLTFGAVLQPDWLPGFGLSVDFYDIKLKGALGQLGIQTIVDNCAAGSQTACGQIVRNSDGYITEVHNTFINIAESRARGVDFEAAYRVPAGNGDINFRVLGTYIDELSFTEPGVPKVDRAGQTGPCSDNCAPRWQGNANVTFKQGPFTLFLQERYIGPGKYDTTWGPQDISDNTVSAAYYTDARVSYDFALGGGDLQAYASVTNLFDRPPELAPNFFFFATQHTNGNLFDQIGRRFTLGITARY